MIRARPYNWCFRNTSGRLTPRDRLAFSLDRGKAFAATATTQTAERVCLAAGCQASVTVAATVAADGDLHGLPQVTTLFEGCNLNRDTTITLAAGVSCLMAEIEVLVRRAMGEAPRLARLQDRRRVSLSDRPLWV